MRTVGVEEELLLLDVHTGRPRSVASQVIAAADAAGAASFNAVYKRVNACFASSR